VRAGHNQRPPTHPRRRNRRRGTCHVPNNRRGKALTSSRHRPNRRRTRTSPRHTRRALSTACGTARRQRRLPPPHGNRRHLVGCSVHHYAPNNRHRSTQGSTHTSCSTHRRYHGASTRQDSGLWRRTAQCCDGPWAARTRRPSSQRGTHTPIGRRGSSSNARGPNNPCGRAITAALPPRAACQSAAATAASTTVCVAALATPPASRWLFQHRQRHRLERCRRQPCSDRCLVPAPAARTPAAVKLAAACACRRGGGALGAPLAHQSPRRVPVCESSPGPCSPRHRNTRHRCTRRVHGRRIPTDKRQRRRRRRTCRQKSSRPEAHNQGRHSRSRRSRHRQRTCHAPSTNLGREQWSNPRRPNRGGRHTRRARMHHATSTR
jgi:hypothetical protein